MNTTSATQTEAPGTAPNPSPAAHSTEPRRRIGLALSGGGIRAAIFHLGVLRYLAEQRLLGSVVYLSTVSGGSLLAGLLFKHNGFKWSSSDDMGHRLHACLKRVLLGKDLQSSYAQRVLLLPWNWRRFAHRADIMADAIRAVWDIKEPLSALPDRPVWAINATTMETGRRWRFRGDEATPGAQATFEMGDGVVGYTEAGDFPLANAMATSAAFPGGISPLLVPTGGRTWKRPNYKQPGHPLQEVQPLYAAYHLADGGVYDNLGLEPLFDASPMTIRATSHQGNKHPEPRCDYLLVSDAGMPFGVKPWSDLSQLLGLSKRTADIMDSQSRNLRVRGLAGAFQRKQCAGLLMRISQSAAAAKKTAEQEGNPRASEVNPDEYFSPATVKQVADYKTTLHCPTETDFQRIEEHGYQTAKVQFRLWGNP